MKKTAALLLSLSFAGAAGMVFAETPATMPHHPRIHEVHHRVKDQAERIDQGLKDGTLTPAQAKALRDVLKSVHAQMEADFKTNGKRELTKEQIDQLNQMLNENSKVIYDEKHPDPDMPAGDASGAAAPPAGAAAGSAPATN